jgi:hypothetical protein
MLTKCCIFVQYVHLDHFNNTFVALVCGPVSCLGLAPKLMYLENGKLFYNNHIPISTAWHLFVWIILADFSRRFLP